MQKFNKVPAVLLGLTLASAALTGCSSTEKQDQSSEQSSGAANTPKASTQSVDDACDLAADALQSAFSAYGEGSADGDAVDAAVLFEKAQKMASDMADAAATITNAEVAAAFAPLVADVAAMAETSEQQLAAKEANGEVSVELNDTLEEQSQKLNDDVQSLEDLCLG